MEILGRNSLTKIFTLMKNRFYILKLEPLSIGQLVEYGRDARGVITLDRNIKNLYLTISGGGPHAYKILGFSGKEISVQCLKLQGQLSDGSITVGISAVPANAKVFTILTGFVEYE